MGSYKYLKEKKSTNGRLKEKKNVVATIATVPLGTVVTVQNQGEKKVAHENKAL